MGNEVNKISDFEMDIEQFKLIDSKSIKDNSVSMNLYEINQQLINNFKPYTSEQRKDLAAGIMEFLNKTDNRTYMLLCRDINYYTMFLRQTIPTPDYQFFWQAVLLCAQDLGDIVNHDIFEDRIEIWVKNGDNLPYVFILFPYDRGVVTFNG